MSSNSKLMKLTGLWKAKDKNGIDYLSGQISPGVQLLIFKNKNKRPDSNDPDYTACLAPVEKHEKNQNAEGDDF